MDAMFQNDDAILLEKVEKVLDARARAGLDGLVGGLAAVVINTAPADLLPAAEELLASTGLGFTAAFDTPEASWVLLQDGLGADFLLKSRTAGRDNPFAPYNSGVKTGPDVPARLETFVFVCHDLARYVAIQKERGVAFLTPEPVANDAYAFMQTAPSPHTGNSLGFIQWKGRPGQYLHQGCRVRHLDLVKPQRDFLAHIGGLDHVATRLRARQRDPAILEFLALTNYCFDFAVYVESLNSITNVARLSTEDYAQVFTSGISFVGDFEHFGPTEHFIASYGVRPHHMAFAAGSIETVVAGLAEHGTQFLSELVGSREEGLKQIFTAMSPRTLLVNEYIQRYDGFDGFFTKSNVTRLTKATEKQ